MAPVSTNDLKNGMTLLMDRNLMQVVEFQHVKPGKGPAFVRSKLKNVRTGAVIENTFRAGESVQRANIDKREMQYLYSEPDGYVFMDTETYDQMSVTVESLGDTANYVIEGASVVLLMYGTEVVGSDLPASVPLTISETEPGIQGDRVSGATKPATLETGLVVQVPLFIEQGEVVKVDTRTGSYISRA
jgi:elongation factor P